MVSYLNSAAYQPNYNQYAQQNTGYNQNQPGLNNYGTNIYQQNNIYSNSLALPDLSSYYSSALPGQQGLNSYNPMALQAPQGLSYNNLSLQTPQGLSMDLTSLQTQQQSAAPATDNSSGMMQQFMMMLMMMFIQNKSSKGATGTTQKTVDQTEVEVEDKKPQTEIATANKGVWGDPHFETKGLDGKEIKFDHKGTAGNTYNIFQGDGYEVDALYKNHTDPNAPRVMDKAKIVAGKDVIEHNSSGQTLINGEELKDGSSQTLKDGTKITASGANMILESKDKDGAKINVTSQDGYINIDPEGKFGNLGGILGTAMKQNKGLTEEESNKFDVTNKK